MQLSHNVTGAVIIIYRVPLREPFKGNGRIEAMDLGMAEVPLCVFVSRCCG